ncbi:hypothetical protein V1512DRAFT_256061 [Lipomyces arxii]|uniref:uncharacterized protein n=1 Tax=Lipomyces arxii TaxID=56418 RepID=UPI0034CD1566
MKSRINILFLLLLASIVSASRSNEAPACYSPCIENTKIISSCARWDLECLCRDEIYQSALYGCFHSQCEGKSLPFAQNLATSNCVRFNVQPGANPHLAKRDLRQYMNRQLSGSMSMSASQSLSSTRYSSGSMSSGMYMTPTYSALEASTTSYAPPPPEAKHIVKRMQEYGMNDCGQSCFYSKLAYAGCSPTDTACICSSAYFNAVTDCLVDSCYDQIPLAFKVRPQLCL